MGLFQKFCEWGTDAKYVKPGKKMRSVQQKVGNNTMVIGSGE